MSNEDPLSALSLSERRDLLRAVDLLESPGYFIRMANGLGAPVESGLRKLPRGAQKVIHEATRTALSKALELALKTLDPEDPKASRDWISKAAVSLTGAAGGFFGAAGLMVELPITTGIMLRSIADIARSEGEDLRSISAKLACLEVFALGGRIEKDDAAESSYFFIRSLLAREISKAAEYLAERSAIGKGSPVMLRLLTAIAERFGIQVGEKVAAEAIPVIGALGGAALNALFLDHFQDMARGHFIVRRLERTHGGGEVARAYNLLALGRRNG